MLDWAMVCLEQARGEGGGDGGQDSGEGAALLAAIVLAERETVKGCFYFVQRC